MNLFLRSQPAARGACVNNHFILEERIIWEDESGPCVAIWLWNASNVLLNIKEDISLRTAILQWIIFDHLSSDFQNQSIFPMPFYSGQENVEEFIARAAKIRRMTGRHLFRNKNGKNRPILWPAEILHSTESNSVSPKAFGLRRRRSELGYVWEWKRTFELLEVISTHFNMNWSHWFVMAPSSSNYVDVWVSYRLKEKRDQTHCVDSRKR